MQVMMVVLVVMTIYQVTKYHIHPEISLIHSNMVTVIFSTLVAGAASYWLFKRQYLLNLLLREEIEHRQLVENQLRSIQQHLECQVAERTLHLEEANLRLAREIGEREAQQQTLRMLNADLEQRMRELSIIHDICRRRPIPRDADQVLSDTVNAIPLAWDTQYLAGARIDCGGRIYASANFNPDHVAASLPVQVGEAQYCLLEISLSACPYGLSGRQAVQIHHDFLISVGDFLSKALERKSAQQEKSNLERRLRQTQKMEALGNLAGGVAHDFNNFLGAIYGYTELAQGLSQNPDLQDHLEQIIAICDRAKELTRQILTFSRLSPSTKTTTDMGRIVKEALKMFQVSLPPNIKLESSLKPDCRILADPVQIFQVVINICTNAVQAMGHEGGRLTLELSDEVAQLPPRKGGTATPKWVRLSIRDTGRGMNREILEHIFEPFFTTKVRSEGTGLGLAVVHGIVKDHQGDIQVESHPGQGTCFHIHLPRIEQTIERQETVPRPLPGKGERLLVVDDDQAQATIFTSLLAGLGYKVHGLCDPCEAWSSFSRAPDSYDLILTDLRMPGFSGAELAQSAHQLRPAIPILVVSGFVDGQQEQNLLEAGVNRILPKPVTLVELSTTLREVLD